MRIPPLTSVCQSDKSVQDEWIRDDEKARSFHGKRVNWKGNGIYTMTVLEAGSDGKNNPGFVRVLLEPWDLNAVLYRPAENDP